MKISFIYFYGPDGAGKTTHAKIVAYYLRRLGYPAKYANVKFHHMLSYIILRLLYQTNSPEWYRGFYPSLNRRIHLSWKILELMSIMPAIFFRVIVPMTLGYIIICDRYLLDSLVTLSYFLKDPSLVSGRLARVLVALIPRGSLLFWMDGNVDVLLSRKGDEPLSAELLEYYRCAYRRLLGIIRLRGLNPVYINTSVGDLKATVVRVIKEVSKRL